jgi:hypothetical protein
MILEGDISRSQKVLSTVNQNKYSQYNGKSLKVIKQKDDMIQITFQKDNWPLRGEKQTV